MRISTRDLPPRNRKADLRRTFGNNGETREEGFWIGFAVFCNLRGVKRANFAYVIDIPKICLGRSGDHCGAVRRNEYLRFSCLEFFYERSLAIGFKPAFDFIDDHDRRLALVLLGNG